MEFIPVLAGGGFNWVGLGIALVVLALVWFVVRTLLKITLKIFAIGCLGILILSGIAFVMVYWK
jgi:hypothetical protein